jgi:hypothetical protein
VYFDYLVEAYVPDEKCLEKLKSLSIVVAHRPKIQSFYQQIAEDRDPRVPQYFAHQLIDGMRKKKSTWLEWLCLSDCF